MQKIQSLSAVVAVDRTAMGEAVRQALVGCSVQVPMLSEDIDRALVACETNQPDVIFISFIFDGSPALELMRIIRRQKGGVGRINPQLPIIITSHNPHPKQIKACMSAGAHEFMALPASRDVLSKLIDRAVTAKRDWIEEKSYFGPDRRRQQTPKLPFADRRKSS